MAKERTSVRMQAQIRILSGQGHSIHSIARILRLSRKTVRKFLEPASEPVVESGGWMERVDWEYVRQEVYCIFRPKSTPIPLANRHSFRSKSALVPTQIDTPV